MKATQLKISLDSKKNKISRTLLVSKTTTYEQLHEMIQVLFNLDGIECYSFQVKDKWIKKDHRDSQKKTISRMKENDIFYYHYDLIDSLHFKIEVLESLNADFVPKCIHSTGKNLYEGVIRKIEAKYQSKVELDWINQSLAYFNENNNFIEQVRNEIQRLIKIRFFQDYMHNQIVRIDLPQNRSIFMGADANEDVVLNLHLNANKLLEYTSINPRTSSQSIIKYHDCLECTLMKRTKVDHPNDFDFNVGQFGVFLSHANVFSNEDVPAIYMNLYIEALRRYVDVMEYCQKNNIKYAQGKMMIYSRENVITHEVGKLNIFNIQFLDETICKMISEQYVKNDSIVEVDVMTFPVYENKLETKVIIGNHFDGYIDKNIYNASIKTMLVEILALLQERWDKVGMDKKIVFRDSHLVQEFEKFADDLGIEVDLKDKLSMDSIYGRPNESKINDVDPQEIIMKIMNELGIDMSDIQQIEVSKEDILEKLESIKNRKKYS